MTLANLQLFVNNRRTLLFRLRRKGSQAFVNLSPSQQVRLECKRIGDPAPLYPVIADRLNPEADWPNGLVAFVVDSSGITARPGTYEAIITVEGNGSEVSYPVGVIDVAERPLPIPAYNPSTLVPISYVAIETYTAPNTSGSSILPGMPLAALSGGVQRATNLDQGRTCVGVAVSQADPGYLCIYVKAGAKLRRDDWTALFGYPSLSGAEVFVGVDGQLIPTRPTELPALFSQEVGKVSGDGKTLTVTLSPILTVLG